MKKTVQCLVLLSCLVVVCLSQKVNPRASFPELKSGESAKSLTTPDYSVGLYGGYSINTYSANFTSLPNVPSCCPGYTTGSGSAPAFGVLGEILLAPNLPFQLRLGYVGLGGVMTTTQTAARVSVLNTATNQVEIRDLMVEYSLGNSLNVLSIEPSVGFNFFGPLACVAGFRLGLPFTNSFTQQEIILSPTSIVFTDGRAIRNDTTGDTPDATSLIAHAVFGVGYHLPLNKKLSLTPEIRFYLPLNNVSSVEWNSSNVQIGLSLSYDVFPSLPVLRDTVFKRDTSVIAVMKHSEKPIKLVKSSERNERIETDVSTINRTTITEEFTREILNESALVGSLAVYGLLPSGEKQLDPTITVEETEAEESFPLLPQLFFEKSSSKLSDELHLVTPSDGSGFVEQNLKSSTLSIYNDLLNVVGVRLKSNAKATLTIVGCTDNLDEEKGNSTLAMERAKSVKDYLVRQWKIEPARLTTRAQMLPSNPSNNSLEQGQSENRRVELTSNSSEILRPVSIKSIERKANPPVVEIVPSVTSGATITKSTITVRQHGQTLREFSQSGKPMKCVWEIDKEPLPKFEEPAVVTLTVSDELGQTKTIEKNITVKQLTIRKKREELKNDKRISRHSLIVFDFNSAQLNATNRAVLAEVKSQIKPDAHVQIIGYTDVVGEREYNVELAKKRCIEAQNILGLRDDQVELIPYGSSKLIFDNSTAEGRAYSRTVQIIIENPVK